MVRGVQFAEEHEVDAARSLVAASHVDDAFAGGCK
jgi:hypothetical protein